MPISAVAPILPGAVILILLRSGDGAAEGKCRCFITTDCALDHRDEQVAIDRFTLNQQIHQLIHQGAARAEHGQGLIKRLPRQLLHLGIDAIPGLAGVVGSARSQSRPRKTSAPSDSRASGPRLEKP